MNANHEAELRVALAEGILTKTEAIALELLMQRGKLSPETFASLRADHADPHVTSLE